MLTLLLNFPSLQECTKGLEALFGFLDLPNGVVALGAVLNGEQDGALQLDFVAHVVRRQKVRKGIAARCCHVCFATVNVGGMAAV